MALTTMGDFLDRALVGFADIQDNLADPNTPVNGERLTGSMLSQGMSKVPGRTTSRAAAKRYDHDAVATRMRHRMGELNMSQAELARVMHVTPTTVHHWTHGGHRFKEEKAIEIARALTVKPGWLLFGDTEDMERYAGDDLEYLILRSWRNMNEGSRRVLLQMVGMLTSDGSSPPDPTQPPPSPSHRGKGNTYPSSLTQPTQRRK